ncbi:MAG: DNA double-strand break repair nuclease NurA [Chloroflexi bacterium]|jgi:hypothetical protein|nr:DNA double-strand break repair nuclease NurA [Chloroflexota bacterium]MBT7082460.1 DNA double-strand break repair nuclease NurA [Chloroflexota bacterium]MBT7290043.1 DNA double-strand break repair nuclease NurA [Chloroflexota bacterium]
MSLDFGEVAAQVDGMVSRIKTGQKDREQRLRYAIKVISEVDTDPLKAKLERSAATCTWMTAKVHEEVNRDYDVPDCPDDYSALATDGSHIDADRHIPVGCGLINIGNARITYGQNTSAQLTSEPTLHMEEVVLAGNMLGLKRAVQECQSLAKMAEGTSGPSVCLVDGSFILWGITGQENVDYVQQLLKGGYLAALDKFRDLRLPLASYISFPRSTDVANALRVAICPFDTANCDKQCADEKKCDGLDGILDRDLFSSVLRTDQRSAIFSSRSKIIEKHYREHAIYFFYLNVGDEIARVEIPAYVAQNNDLLEAVHTMVLDQCRRGHGYPVVLMEAHEQAVLTGADREQFWRLVETMLEQNDLPASTSAKSLSKRTRWI